ncbi:hypothetical protein LIER_32836 [Lithospermum erythrorhizon]|uniref:Uncharacterized protein n=1 Tax=Lithospermum erythrorhizon TaxID=34254 RepID=A0AAV3RUY6_LITER
MVCTTKSWSRTEGVCVRIPRPKEDSEGGSLFPDAAVSSSGFDISGFWPGVDLGWISGFWPGDDSVGISGV